MSKGPLLSDHTRTALRFFAEDPKNDWKYTIFLKIHGNLLTVALASLLLCFSLASTLMSSPSAYDIFYSLAWFFTLQSCVMIETVCIRRKKRIELKYRHYLKVMLSIEKTASEDELQSSNLSWKQIEMVRKTIWYSYAVVSMLACLTPISDSRLPTSLKGLPVTDYRIIALQVTQCILVPPLAISSCHVIEIIVTNVLCFEAAFIMMSKRLRVVKNNDQLINVIRPHSALLESCRQIQKDFEAWTFLLYSLLGSTSIFGTLSLFSGVLQFELASFLFSQVLFFINLSILGDKLEHSSSQFTDIAYFTPWYLAPIKFRKNLAFVILGSQRPAAIRCGIFGVLGFPTALRQFNTWYKFLQFLRKT